MFSPYKFLSLWYNFTMKIRLKDITICALFAALVLVSSKIEFRAFDTRFHLGNTFCILAGLFLNAPYAGLAGGVGSALYDLIFYGNGAGFIFTFINKFFLSFVCSLVFRTLSGKTFIRVIASGVLGQITYIFLYLLKTFVTNFFIAGMPLDAALPILVAKGGVSAINAIVAVVLATVLYHILVKAGVEA